jgi:hypothetical protein
MRPVFIVINPPFFNFFSCMFNDLATGRIKKMIEIASSAGVYKS